jgi:phosphoadenosine phosphosulfate reductase
MPALPDPTWRDLAHLPAPSFLTHAIERVGRVAMVSSFGADSAVLLHMVAQFDRTLPVIFIDTLALFPETLAYQQELAQTLGLRDIRRITPNREALFARDPDALLHLSDRESCCRLRKAEPLERALQGFDGWITGRKRFQADTRASLAPVEREPGTGRIRLNPLAGWSAAEIAAYLDRQALPRHPLVARGFPSIGCQPCTSPVRTGEDARAGRWRGSAKTECGIHFIGGVPQPKAKDSAA